MAEISRRAALRELGIGRDLSESGLEKLASLASIDRFVTGETIFREGQRYTQVHWVWLGRITLEMIAGGKISRALLTVGKGELLAWSALVGHQRMTASATAMVDTVLLGFPASDLLKLCDDNHEIGYRIMQRIAEGLSQRLLATRLQLLDLFDAPNESPR